MRFQEANDQFSASQLDFVPRERRHIASRLAAAFITIALFIIILGFIPNLKSHSYPTFVVAGVIIGLGYFVVSRFQQNLDLIMSTEFQNMLFSQAFSIGTVFCLFARRDGTIVYANSGLRELFGPETSEAQALETVFRGGQVAMADRERIMGAIYSNTGERLIFPITAPSGHQKNYVLTVEPIARPQGYVMIRGREYRGERQGAQVMPNMLRSTSADKLDHLLSTTPIGHYATDAFGRFEYVNHAFEQMLGYQPGEMIEQRLTLPRILYQMGGRPVPEDYTLGDFSGDAVVQGKSLATADCLLYQTVIRDERGKTIGASGSVIASAALQ